MILIWAGSIGLRLELSWQRVMAQQWIQPRSAGVERRARRLVPGGDDARELTARCPGATMGSCIAAIRRSTTCSPAGIGSWATNGRNALHRRLSFRAGAMLS